MDIRKNNEIVIGVMKRAIAFLLIVALLSCSLCSRSVYRVTYSNVCGSWGNFLYTSKETLSAKQYYDPIVGYTADDDATRIRTIVGVNVIDRTEEEIYLFSAAPIYAWGSMDVSNGREKIAVVLRDTLCIIFIVYSFWCY